MDVLNESTQSADVMTMTIMIMTLPLFREIPSVIEYNTAIDVSPVSEIIIIVIMTMMMIKIMIMIMILITIIMIIIIIIIIKMMIMIKIMIIIMILIIITIITLFTEGDT